MAGDFAGHFKCLNRAINANNTTQPLILIRPN